MCHRALITGPEGTPYQNGCFLFDVWLPPEYPNKPPKVLQACSLPQTLSSQWAVWSRGRILCACVSQAPCLQEHASDRMAVLWQQVQFLTTGGGRVRTSHGKQPQISCSICWEGAPRSPVLPVWHFQCMFLVLVLGDTGEGSSCRQRRAGTLCSMSHHVDIHIGLSCNMYVCMHDGDV